VDEDRRNPAYIPKHGLFYEHDDRLESGDEAEGEDGERPAAENEGDVGDKVARVRHKWPGHSFKKLHFRKPKRLPKIKSRVAFLRLTPPKNGVTISF
jgi:hypothetical protein